MKEKNAVMKKGGTGKKEIKMGIKRFGQGAKKNKELLLEKLRRLMKGDVKAMVRGRICEFGRAGRSGDLHRFSEMCFCILTANYSASGGMRIQESIGRGFHSLGHDRLTDELRRLGHRFPNTRSGFIVGARGSCRNLSRVLDSGLGSKEKRDWIVSNIKGLGMKEASHFLRNIGFLDVAIIDFHIIDVLVGHGIIERPRTLTEKRYLEIEEALSGIAGELGLQLGELDLYLWYLETGKILK